MRISLASSLVAVSAAAATLASTLPAPTASAATPSTTAADATQALLDLSCTGRVHAQAIDLWKQTAQPYFADQIDSRLRKSGDVYALYDTQEELQAFVEMTRRCRDVHQMDEIVTTLNPVFSALRPLPSAPDVLGWVCTGGHICTPANRRLGNEVLLDSAQFLGLLGALATAIVENVPAPHRTPAEKTFLSNVASLMATKINNWLSPLYFAQVTKRLRMTPADAEDGSVRHVFADHDLWFMTNLSDLAELHEAGVTFDAAGDKAFGAVQAKDRQIASLFDLFVDRVTLIDTADGPRAEIDRGYWRNYADDHYALYTGALSPVLCRRERQGKVQQILRVPAEASYIDPEVGWDISHARRLVPALATFQRNRQNLARAFGYSNSRFKPDALQRAFANQLVAKIWNQDSQHPLFSNFWDGSNGWYRAGYENGTGACRPGTPPYGLAWSIPTGGYLQWGAANSIIRALGTALYRLLNNEDPESRAFVAEFYPQLEVTGASRDTTAKVWRLTMLSSLVE